MRPRPAIVIFWYRHRIEVVMWMLIAEMLVSPLADYHRRAGAGLGLLGLVTLLIGVTVAGSRRVVRFAVLPTAGIWAVARGFEAFGDSTKIYAQLAPVAGLALSCSILLAIFDHFNSVPNIPRNAIAEAFICYLIIAIAFSQVYWILNRVLDHAFNQPILVTRSGTFLYFSMITLTSVGYGGIAPVNLTSAWWLRWRAWLESFMWP